MTKENYNKVEKTVANNNNWKNSVTQRFVSTNNCAMWEEA